MGAVLGTGERKRSVRERGVLRRLERKGWFQQYFSEFCSFGKVLRKCLKGSDRLRSVRGRSFSGAFCSFRGFDRFLQFLRGDELKASTKYFKI